MIVGRIENLVKPPTQISHALKSWLDNVIVPALVKEYIAETQSNKVASRGRSRLESPVKVELKSEANH